MIFKQTGVTGEFLGGHSAMAVCQTILLIGIVTCAGCGKVDSSDRADRGVSTDGNEIMFKTGCTENLKQLGASLAMYCNESTGQAYPAGVVGPTGLVCSLDELYPAFLPEPRVVLCPGSGDKMTMSRGSDLDGYRRELVRMSSYWYFPFAVSDEPTALAALHAIPSEGASEPWLIDDDIELTALAREYVESALGKSVTESSVVRLRMPAGAARYFITDATVPDSEKELVGRFPVFVEKPGHHAGGGYVLYSDGEVAFCPLGEFPLTEQIVAALEALKSAP